MRLDTTDICEFGARVQPLQQRVEGFTRPLSDYVNGAVWAILDISRQAQCPGSKMREVPEEYTLNQSMHCGFKSRHRISSRGEECSPATRPLEGFSSVRLCTC